LAKDKKIWLDSTGIAQDQLTAVVGFVMANRRDRIVYVDADPQVSYEEFAQFLNKITSAQVNLRIALLTPRLQESIKNASVALCELEWPGH
jgi:biopolymer transport protein ExbD